MSSVEEAVGKFILVLAASWVVAIVFALCSVLKRALDRKPRRHTKII